MGSLLLDARQLGPRPFAFRLPRTSLGASMIEIDLYTPFYDPYMLHGRARFRIAKEPTKRHDVSVCEWGGMLAGTLMYTAMDPDLVGQNVGPGLLDSWPSELSLTSVGAYLPLSPRPMLGLGPDTRASSKLQKAFTVIDATGSHQKISLTFRKALESVGSRESSASVYITV